MILGIDVSRYDEKIDWTYLKQQGVEFAIVKATQGDYLRDRSLEEHLTRARAAGLTCGVYHWSDPLRPDEAQVSFFLNSIRTLPWQFLCLDVEQYWSDWNKWSNQSNVVASGKRKGARKPPLPPRISPSRISQNARTVAALIRKEYPEKRLVIYTRTSFVLQYARPMLNWLPEYPLWLAQYPYWRDLPAAINWSDLYTKATQPHAVPHPHGCQPYTFWQCSGDRFTLPGISSRPDVNIFRGEVADLLRWAGNGSPTA